MLHRDKGSGSAVNGLKQIPLPLTVLPRPMPLTSDHEKQNSTNQNTDTQDEAGGQNKVVTPEEKIRMTKENGTESGELWGGGQRRWRC